MKIGALAIAGALAVLAACGGEESLSSLSQPIDRDLLVVPDPSGVSLVDTSTGSVVTRVADGIRSRDFVFQSRLLDAGTRLIAVGGRGEAAWQKDLDGALTARVVSADSSLIALLPSDEPRVDPYNPIGRTTTRLSVVSTHGAGLREYELDGNFEPEAFASSGRSLFVIEYLPAMQPDRYRVRKLDLDSGRVELVRSVDGHLQESMRGTARVHAASADGSRLYTLYTTDGPDGSTAFVHVLDLAGEWAHCVDLPAPIGSSPEEQLAITVAPDGSRVAVVDALAGVAEIDASSLTVTNTTSMIVNDTQPGSAIALLGDDGSLYTGRGTGVAVLDSALAYSHTWDAPGTLVGLYRDPSGGRLWAMGQDAIYGLDPSDGRVLRFVALPADMPPIEVPAPPDDAPIQCAC